MACYLCGSSDLQYRKGKVRDSPDLKILECKSCGLVQLSSNSHISDSHYEESGMHGTDQLPSVEQITNSCLADDTRRFNQLRALITNKNILDFGCGYAGFLKLAKEVARTADGVEPELRVREHFSDQFIIYADVDEVPRKYDVITSFHVVEHLIDPCAVIKKLSNLLAPGGTLIVEVPSSSDVLLGLYDCAAFQEFTYWSQHLYLFNSHTLGMLIKNTDLSVNAIIQFQRYPLSNHLHWLSQSAPGGHVKWSFLDSDLLSEAYAKALAKIGACDTLIAHFRLPESI